jgi:hypothetical protein
MIRQGPYALSIAVRRFLACMDDEKEAIGRGRNGGFVSLIRPATATLGAPLAASHYADARTLSTAVIAAIIIGGVNSNLPRKLSFKI